MSTAEELKQSGNDRFKKGEYAVALTLYSQAIDMLPTGEKEGAVIYANRSNAHFQLGDFMEARADAEKAIEIDPNYVKGYWRLAEICRCTYKQDEALRHLQKAYELSPRSKMIAEQLINMQQYLKASHQKPRLDFFSALAGIPCRSFDQPASSAQNLQNQPRIGGGMNPYGNMFGTTGTAPAEVSETGRDFIIPENLVEQFQTPEDKTKFLGDLLRYSLDQKLLHSTHLITLMKQLAETLEKIPVFFKADVTDPDSTIRYVGDLHGSILDFNILFTKRNDLTKFSKSNDTLVILGDYVDRGPFGQQIFQFLAALKILYPQRVHLLRGNHETPQMNNFFGFQSQIEQGYGSKSNIFGVMSQVFAQLPLCLFLDNRAAKQTYMCFHGGAPINSEFKTWVEMLNSPIQKALEPSDPVSQQLLWSDPSPIEDSLRPSHRGVGYCYGKSVFTGFRTKIGVQKIFRGHEVVFNEGGVRDDFSDGTHFTVFSSSNYMGQGNTGGIVEMSAATGEVKVLKMSFL